MNTSASTLAPVKTQTCQERRRAAKAVVSLARANALARKAGANGGGHSRMLLRRANAIRAVEASARGLRERQA